MNATSPICKIYQGIADRRQMFRRHRSRRGCRRRLTYCVALGALVRIPLRLAARCSRCSK
ncbi:DUF1419 domain-containing protein [Mesorhizobium sp. M4A.F.Ca.ET.022.05.2.1]|nr:DUF1419 domain-containing protein [Mesorhizobium sp. M4A.F.Ca.ET.022.05.2.1]